MTEEGKQLLDKIITLIESDMMRGVVASKVIQQVGDYVKTLEITENTSDGFHTFKELYEYRLLYNAAFFNNLKLASQAEGSRPVYWMNVHKSKRHSDGEECFGGGWFIVMANLPTGQISNHYELKDWDLFDIPAYETAEAWDGHSPADVADRMRRYLEGKD